MLEARLPSQWEKKGGAGGERSLCVCWGEIAQWKDTCWQIIWPSVWATTELHARVSCPINYKRQASQPGSAHCPHLSPLTRSHSRHFVSGGRETCNWRRPHSTDLNTGHFGAFQPPVNIRLAHRGHRPDNTHTVRAFSNAPVFGRENSDAAQHLELALTQQQHGPKIPPFPPFHLPLRHYARVLKITAWDVCMQAVAWHHTLRGDWYQLAYMSPHWV